MTPALLLVAMLSASGVGPTTGAVAYDPDMHFGLWDVSTRGNTGLYDSNKWVLGQDILVKAFTWDMRFEDYLDRAHSQGMRVVMAMNDVTPEGDGFISSAEVRRLQAWVRRARNHPALFGYLTVREPIRQGISVSEIQRLRRVIKRLDRVHPVIALMGGTSERNWGSNWTAGMADMLWVNFYPVQCSGVRFLQGAQANFTRVRTDVNKDTPGTEIWLLTQGHGYRPGNRCQPTPDELTKQVQNGFRYLKADGILFYIWSGPAAYSGDLSRSPALQERIKLIMRQIRTSTFRV
jgi:hypothetical protein